VSDSLAIAEKNWEQVNSNLKNLLEPVLYDTWISPLKLVKYNEKDGILYLVATDDFKKAQLEKRYVSLILEEAKDFFDEIDDIIFLLPDAAAHITGGDEPVNPFDGTDNLISPMKTFDTFIEGDNSRFAYTAALSVAESAKKPNQGYNPLFIYGGSGLGKSHLMQAIANFVIGHYPKLKILYIASETFVEEFVTANRNKNMNSFKAKYRNIDMLMIDDIQFIEQKDKTIEEVFHTYTTLYGMGKQLVFTSDRPPKDLLGLDDRLKSRLASGLIVDLQPPAFEIKVAILRNKAVLEGIELSQGLLEVINIIAEKIKSNVREMEGAFNSIVAYSTLCGQPVSKAIAKQALSDIISAEDVMPTADSIKKVVSKYYDVKISDLESSRRARNYSVPRQIAMYLCREMTTMSLPMIGGSFNRDHTTVMHAYDKIKRDISDSEGFSVVIRELEETIRSI
jgi:chromosomal replication initiator protein